MSGIEPLIDVERSTLGKALRSGPLNVPDFQREYSWKPERVKKLFDDLSNAMVKRQPSYFLGSIVLTPGHPPNIIDGQQRLATTVIFLSAVRDAFLELGKDDDAIAIENDFLSKYDRPAGQHVPLLGLNIDDREFMQARIIDRHDSQRKIVKRLRSHELIDDAAIIAKKRVAIITEASDSVQGKVEALNAWVNFIDSNALVVKLTPPNSTGAFQIFKTQNDRGQKTSQADLIKSHLLEQSQARRAEAQAKWSSMRATIEELRLGGNDDPLLTYLHHVSIVVHGPIKADDIFEHLEDGVTGGTNAFRFLENLATYANDYAAMLTPSHSKWGAYDRRMRRYVYKISHEIRMSFIRPLMLAVTSHFSATETAKAYRNFLSWVVRFLVAGGSRSGVVEKAFGEAANKIYRKRITTADELCDEVQRVIPNDVKFASAFARKSLASGRQARFILRELESQRRFGTSDDSTEATDDTDILTLEHILPKNLSCPKWQHFTPDQRKQYRKRIGNLVLINSKDNGAINDAEFPDKRPVIAKSSNLKLTADVISRTEGGQDWTIKHIEARQEMLALLARDRWPVHFKKRAKKKKKG